MLLAVGCKSSPTKEEHTQASPTTADSSRANIPADGRLPVITHWKPKSGDRHPAILLAHGGGGPELVFGKWLRPYTEALTDAGYDVYMPHYFQRKQASEVETMRLVLSFMQEQKN